MVMDAWIGSIYSLYRDIALLYYRFVFSFFLFLIFLFFNVTKKKTPNNGVFIRLSRGN